MNEERTIRAYDGTNPVTRSKCRHFNTKLTNRTNPVTRSKCRHFNRKLLNFEYCRINNQYLAHNYRSEI